MPSKSERREHVQSKTAQQVNRVTVVTVFGLDGSKKGTIAVPKVFRERIKLPLIKRAVLSIESAERQPKGVKYQAGRLYTAIYRGARWLPGSERTINIDRARLPRRRERRHLVQGQVANVPQAIKGPVPHPPKPETVLKEGINKKEKRSALKSAIAASVELEWVKAKHKVEEGIVLPLVVEGKFERLNKTKNLVETLKALKVYADVESAKDKKRVRAGKGKRRGRKYKLKKSLLIVTGENAPVYKAARNLSGVDINCVRNLNARDLAPGTSPGRLVVWTEQAMKALEAW